MRGKIQVHAVVRHDLGLADIASAISVVAVVPTLDVARSDVRRLQQVNAGKGCTYFWTPTRYYPDGRGVGQGAD